MEGRTLSKETEEGCRLKRRLSGGVENVPKAVPPEVDRGSDKAGDEKDGCGYPILLEDRIGIGVVVLVTVVESDRNGPGRQCPTSGDPSGKLPQRDRCHPRLDVLDLEDEVAVCQPRMLTR